MIDDPLLDTPISPAHQALAARLALASVDHDAYRTAARLLTVCAAQRPAQVLAQQRDDGLSEVIEGGMGVALACTP
jgi:hypothetical protein